MNPQLLNAEDLGIKLEIAGNLAIWEASPVYKHQKEVDRIRDSIKKSDKNGVVCNCIDVADVYVQFPDGSLKRPDVSIFCREPEEQEEAINQVPEAVIEVISKKYEAKDLEISPPIYLAKLAISLRRPPTCSPYRSMPARPSVIRSKRCPARNPWRPSIRQRVCHAAAD